MNTLTDTRLH